MHSSLPTTNNHIPSVPALPKIGRLAQFQRDPLGLLMEVATYGETAQVEVMTRRIVNLQNPDHIRYVLVENSRNYDALIHTRLLLRYWLGEGLFTSDGTKWLTHRRLMQPLFNRQQVQAYGDLMVETIAEFSKRFKSPVVVDVMDLMMELTVTIAARSMFSTDLGSDANEFSRAVTNMVQYYGDTLRSGWLVILPDKSLTWSGKFRNSLLTLNDIVGRLIRERRTTTEPQEDLLSRLMEAKDEETQQGMSDNELRDEIMTMLFAGHETTASVMAWTWYLLGQHTEIRDKVRNEACNVLQGRPARVADLPNLPYTLMVLQEVMRLYPPVWGIFRNTREADRIGEYTVTPGTRISISPYVLHRNPAFFPNPDIFDPERFSPERLTNLPKFAYIPFGAGPRQCIGQHMATLEMQLALAYLIQHTDFNLLTDKPVSPEALLTLRPQQQIMMEVRSVS